MSAASTEETFDKVSTEDTCSGDTDDVCSLCSWTTDQDFDDVERQRLTYEAACLNDSASQSLNTSPWNHATGSSFSSAPAAQYQCAVGGAMPVWSETCPGGSVAMCVGYIPSMIPMCYVVMPTVDNAMPWVDSNAMQMQPRQVDDNRQWQQHAPSVKHAPGRWSNHPQAAPTSKGQTSKSKPGKSHAVASKVGALASQQSAGTSEATTVILRNLPVECTRDLLLQILDEQGFRRAYDFVHLPVDFQTKAPLGYALVNLVNGDMALRIQEHFRGFTKWPCSSDNVCEVAWNSPHQGLATHIDRYRNSPLMHASVPEAFRPVLLKNGVPVKFPAPTARIRAPRIRHQKPAATAINV